jgi:hypothetical protein
MRSPPGGVIVRVPGDRPIRSATLNNQPVADIRGREIRLSQAAGMLVVETGE